MLKTNYHTHTSRCGHAIGTDEEYVQKAIQGGLKTLGFSDHTPYKIPYDRERMRYEQYDDYKDSILSLKKKYADQINIYLGLEVEYYPSEWEDLTRYRKEMDYCIMGQHYLSFQGINSYHISDADTLFKYVEVLDKGGASNLADYIAHPDVILYGWQNINDSSLPLAGEKIADISLKYNLPLELNCGGVKRGMKEYSSGLRYPYPTRVFFEQFAKKHCPIIIGLDVHDPDLFLTDKDLNNALEAVEGLDLNILYDYDLISEAKKRKKLFFQG